MRGRPREGKLRDRDDRLQVSAIASGKICWWYSFSLRSNAILQDADERAEISAIKKYPLGNSESYRRYMFDDTDKEAYMRVKRIRSRYKCTPNKNPFRFEAEKYEHLLKWLLDRVDNHESLKFLDANGKIRERRNPTARGLNWEQARNAAGKLQKFMPATSG